MLILYDFQREFESVEVGEFTGNGPIFTRRGVETTASVELVEDVKTIHVFKRAAREAGIDIQLSGIDGLREGDRLTITGRVREPQAYGRHWLMALIAPGGGQITQYVAPDSVFYLSHILEAAELAQTFIVHTIGWGAVQPLMDFFIDSVLIIRKEQDDEADMRTIVYSLAEDPGIQEADVFGNTLFVVRSGDPAISMFKRGNTGALHIGNRANNYDGVDINLSRMDLRAGNQYQVTVHGRMDGDVPSGTTIMFQGLPGYTWKSITPVSEDDEFTLTHILSRSDVEKWNSLRITTNNPGLSASFYIYSIDIVRL